MATAGTESDPQKLSRNGKRPLPLAQGVEATIKGQEVTLKGPKGSISRAFRPEVKIEQKDSTLLVSPMDGSGQVGTQFQGTTRAVLGNMHEGVVNGYKKSLDFRGVGYRAEFKEGVLKMTVGMSWQPLVKIPSEIKVVVETMDEGGTKFPRVHLESVDKELLGKTAARIRSLRPPEPYKGKGVRYTGERVKQKQGKTGK
jgi:large subunit ribosomal protein L6